MNFGAAFLCSWSAIYRESEEGKLPRGFPGDEATTAPDSGMSASVKTPVFTSMVHRKLQHNGWQGEDYDNGGAI